MALEPRSDASLLPLLAGSCAWQGLEDQQPLECMQRVWENGCGSRSALRPTDSCYFPWEVSVLGDSCCLPPISVGAWGNHSLVAAVLL